MLRTLIVEVILGHVSGNRNKVSARTEFYQVLLATFTIPADGRLAY